jgi:RES domain-containing protein
MLTYRIADCRYIADLSGTGAALYGGRWNSKDTFVLYTAESAALALLECVAHLGRFPATGYYIATVEVPDSYCTTLEQQDLPKDWNKNPAPTDLKAVGDRFFHTKKFLSLRVPSVLLPEEHNLILNTQFKHYDRVRIIAQRPLTIDDRLLRV